MRRVALAAILTVLLAGVPAQRLVISIETPARLFVGASEEVAVRVDQAGRARPVDFTMIAEQTGEADRPHAVAARAGAAASKPAITIAQSPAARTPGPLFQLRPIH